MLLLKNLPVGSLPYEKIELTTKLMVKFFEHYPFLAHMPNVEGETDLISRAFVNMPGVKTNGKKFVYSGDNSRQLLELDEAYNNPTEDSLKNFGFDCVFLERYLQALKRIKPKETVVNFLGPITFSQLLKVAEFDQILNDKFYRKYVIQAVSVKVMWLLNKIQSVVPDTQVLVVLEETFLNKVNSIVRENPELERGIIIAFYSKVIQKIQSSGAQVCVQSFDKCDWKIPIEAGVDMISFDAYTNPNNLSIIAPVIVDYLKKGGMINWAIVPVNSENTIKNLTLEYLQTNLKNCFDDMVLQGVNRNLLRQGSTVSIQGNLDKFAVIFAEKAIMLTNQLSQKIVTI